MRAAWFLVLVGYVLGCGAGQEPARKSSQVEDGPALSLATSDQVLEAVRQPGARAVVVNVWATWCGPCREEFPDLVRIERAYRDRGLRLVLVSADFEDQETAARQFLSNQGVEFASFLKTGDDMRFIEGLNPVWTGALPATFVYDGHGTLRHFQEGRTDYAHLEPLVLAAMSATDSLAKEASR